MLVGYPVILLQRLSRAQCQTFGELKQYSLYISYLRFMSTTLASTSNGIQAIQAGKWPWLVDVVSGGLRSYSR